MRHALLALPILASIWPAHAGPGEAGGPLSARVRVTRLGNEAERLAAGQALFAHRHGMPAATVSALRSEGAFRDPVDPGWTLGADGGLPEYPLPEAEADELCEEAARLARFGVPVSCAETVAGGRALRLSAGAGLAEPARGRVDAPRAP